MKINITNQVRQYASVQNLIRKKQVQKDLNLPKEQVKSAVETLCSQGFLKRISHGLYKFCDKTPAQKNTVENKIRHALRINPVFTAGEIALQTGSTTKYIYKRLKCYLAEGLIKPSGRKKNVTGGYEKVWRLTGKGQVFFKGQVLYREFKPEPIIEATVNLNRLICSGRVICDDTARREAINLCQNIAKKLKEEDQA